MWQDAWQQQHYLHQQQLHQEALRRSHPLEQDDVAVWRQQQQLLHGMQRRQ